MSRTRNTNGRILGGRTRLRRGGFSFLELIIVILLTGIIAAVASLSYVDVLGRFRAQRRAEQVAADIQAVRHAARNQSQSMSLSFDLANNRYTITGLANPDHPTRAYQVNLAEAPLTARLSSVIFGSDGMLQFNSFGVPDSGGSVTIDSGVGRQTVTVTAGSGAVSIP